MIVNKLVQDVITLVASSGLVVDSYDKIAQAIKSNVKYHEHEQKRNVLQEKSQVNKNVRLRLLKTIKSHNKYTWPEGSVLDVELVDDSHIPFLLYGPDLARDWVLWSAIQGNAEVLE